KTMLFNCMTFTIPTVKQIKTAQKEGNYFTYNHHNLFIRTTTCNNIHTKKDIEDIIYFDYIHTFCYTVKLTYVSRGRSSVEFFIDSTLSRINPIETEFIDDYNNQLLIYVEPLAR